MSNKEIEKVKEIIEYGTYEYYCLDLRDMINSVYCYDDFGKDYDKYMENRYILGFETDKSYCGGKGRLTLDTIERIVKEQVDYLVENATINYNVGTDSEGVVYNSLQFKND